MSPAEHAATFATADQAQKAALAEVSRLGDVKMRAVLAMRDAGLSFAQIGELVGMSWQGVQRIADKANRQ